ncbi:SMI1/KNR4 family protein [Microbispora sp. ATCC PTA-5024]|uniref:SMI1/KNR4 family protein n=1 Tax=Microbispora sp. ATCC PTA-5024 TaxID=316330 RepID=UPI0012ED7120|nr:SMI1/KNR4 family protein [Microbispora sp. ATCC PTA-5024]
MSVQYAWSDLFPAEEPMPEGPDRPPIGPDDGLHPPASELEVSQLEERLRMSLPPSYRQFLLFANGWGVDEYSLRPVADVGWLRDLEPWMVESWSSPEGEKPWSVPDDLYLVYGEEQDCVHLREEYLPGTLLVGHWDDGEFLLNPHVKTADGEWEAWYLAPWLPGANRHRSFWDLMKGQLS